MLPSFLLCVFFSKLAIGFIVDSIVFQYGRDNGSKGLLWSGEVRRNSLPDLPCSLAPSCIDWPILDESVNNFSRMSVSTSQNYFFTFQRRQKSPNCFFDIIVQEIYCHGDNFILISRYSGRWWGPTSHSLAFLQIESQGRASWICVALYRGHQASPKDRWCVVSTYLWFFVSSTHLNWRVVDQSMPFLVFGECSLIIWVDPWGIHELDHLIWSITDIQVK